METELTWDHLSTEFSGLFNLSNTTTGSSIGKKTLKWTNAEIARLIQIIIRPILIILGTVGNCFNIVYYAKNFIEGCIKLFLHDCFGFG